MEFLFSSQAKPHEYAAQIKLAKQITLLVHGGEQNDKRSVEKTIVFLFLHLEKGLESAIRSTQAMFAQNIDLLHQLTEKEIDGLAMSIPTIQMNLNPGKSNRVLPCQFIYRDFS